MTATRSVVCIKGEEKKKTVSVYIDSNIIINELSNFTWYQIISNVRNLQ